MTTAHTTSGYPDTNARPANALSRPALITTCANIYWTPLRPAGFLGLAGA